jgi:MacB-like periplasmic core domain
MPGYFAALGIPIVEGRDFTEADDHTRPGVIIINKFAAETLFPGESAVGQQIRWGNNQDYDPWMTVVGVVGNTKWQPAEREPGFDTYWSYRQYAGPNNHFLIRTAADPASLLPLVRRTIQDTHPDAAIERIEEMSVIASNAVWQRKL